LNLIIQPLKDDIVVAIWMVTYNHEDYVEKAIESVMMQKSKYKYKLFIGEDNSTDKTREICISLKNKYQNKIELFLHEKNLGANTNGYFMYEQCIKSGSNYIAICEGDDYWTDPFKLEKQVYFLEKNLEYGLVHHEADYFFQKNGLLIKNHHKSNSIFPSNGFVFDELLISNNIYSPTVIFRSSLFQHINNAFKNNFLLADYAIWLEFSQHTNIYYFSESMAVYRVLEKSASKNTSYDKEISFINSYFDIKLFFLNKYPVKGITHDTIEQWRLSGNLSYAIKYKKRDEIRKYASKIKISNWRILLKIFFSFSPFLFRIIQKKNKH
jgi:glycosyltransferase involved in cell wall biosynthesis